MNNKWSERPRWNVENSTSFHLISTMRHNCILYRLARSCEFSSLKLWVVHLSSLPSVSTWYGNQWYLVHFVSLKLRNCKIHYICILFRFPLYALYKNDQIIWANAICSGLCISKTSARPLQYHVQVHEILIYAFKFPYFLAPQLEPRI